MTNQISYVVIQLTPNPRYTNMTNFVYYKGIGKRGQDEIEQIEVCGLPRDAIKFGDRGYTPTYTDNELVSIIQQISEMRDLYIDPKPVNVVETYDIKPYDSSGIEKIYRKRLISKLSQYEIDILDLHDQVALTKLEE